MTIHVFIVVVLFFYMYHCALFFFCKCLFLIFVRKSSYLLGAIFLCFGNFLQRERFAREQIKQEQDAAYEESLIADRKKV
jgi:hypothetical protein